MPYYRNAIHNLTLWKSAYVVVVLGRQGTDYHTSLHHQLTFYIVMFKKNNKNKTLYTHYKCSSVCISGNYDEPDK